MALFRVTSKISDAVVGNYTFKSATLLESGQSRAPTLTPPGWGSRNLN